MVLDSTADTTSELLRSYQALKAQHTALQADVKVGVWNKLSGSSNLLLQVSTAQLAVFACTWVIEALTYHQLMARPRLQMDWPSVHACSQAHLRCMYRLLWKAIPNYLNPRQFLMCSTSSQLLPLLARHGLSSSLKLCDSPK